MYRIRFHGRGGEGMKTSSRILGTSFFLQGYEVQDAPKYGAERRGAPMSSYVRADRKTINERGMIYNPDLIIAAEESLLSSIPEIIIEGSDARNIILVNSSGNVTEWKEKFNVKSKIIYLPLKISTSEYERPVHMISTACAAAAAGLTDVITWNNLENAIIDEHSSLSETEIKENIDAARYSYDSTKSSALKITESETPATEFFQDPEWINMESEHSGISAPAIHHTCTSIKNITGTWRTLRPEIREDLCSRCSLCAVYCPDNTIKFKENGFPEIDYTHCKGCLICASVCPKHAIEYFPEKSGLRRSHFRGDI